MGLIVALGLVSPGNAEIFFGPKLEVATGSDPTFVALGDINSDGKQDLLTANWNIRSLSVLLNETPLGEPLSFAQNLNIDLGVEAFSVALGDLNGDRNPDLAGVFYLGGGAGVLANETPAGSDTPTFRSLDLPILH